MKITAVANDNGYRFRTIESAKAKGISRVKLIPVSRTCPMCHKSEVRKYPEDGIRRYLDGALVQDAFPDADASEREWYKTGFCDACQDILFAEPEEKFEEEEEVDTETEFQFLNK